MGLLDDLKAKGTQLANDVNAGLSGQTNIKGAALEKLFHDLGAITHLESMGRADESMLVEKQRVLADLAAAEEKGPLAVTLKSVAPPPPAPPVAPPPPGGAAAVPPPAPGAPAPAPTPPPAPTAAPPAPASVEGAVPPPVPTPPPAPTPPTPPPAPAPAAPPAPAAAEPVSPPPPPGTVAPPPPPSGPIGGTPEV